MGTVYKPRMGTKLHGVTSLLRSIRNICHTIHSILGNVPLRIPTAGDTRFHARAKACLHVNGTCKSFVISIPFIVTSCNNLFVNTTVFVHRILNSYEKHAFQI